MSSARRPHRLGAVILSVALVAGLLFVGPAAATESGASTQRAFVDKAVREANGITSALVHVRPQASLSDGIAVAQGAGAEIGTSYDSIKVFVAYGTAATFARISESSAIEAIEANKKLKMFTETSHRATRGQDVLDGDVTLPGGTIIDGTGVGVAVVDSGIDGTHPDLVDRMGGNVKIICSTPQPVATSLTGFTQCLGPKQAVPLEDTDTPSLGGHGTHVAGIVAGTGSVSGGTYHGAAPGAKLFGVSVGTVILVENGLDGLNWVLENHDQVSPAIKVVNNSWGGSYTPYDPQDAPFHKALWKLQDDLIADGVSVVFANGNAGGNGSASTTSGECVNPRPGLICVANYNDGNSGTRSGSISANSSRGKSNVPLEWPDISAPGTNIISTCRVTLPVCTYGSGAITNENNYRSLSGTSMAAPHIAGIVAQLYQADPTLTPAEVENLLEDTAYKFQFGSDYGLFTDPTNPDNTSSYEKGHGLVDVVAALQAVLGGSGPTDSDGDGVADTDDNCLQVANPGQQDADGDGVGDACDVAADADGDGVADDADNCPSDPNPGQEDADGDGTGDACEADPVARTLYMDGTNQLGEVDQAASGTYLQLNAAAGSAEKSMMIPNYVAGPNSQCAGNSLFPVFVGSVSGRVVGNLQIAFPATASGGNVEIRIWPDLASQLCNAAYPQPAGSVQVALPSGEGTVQATIPDLDFIAEDSMMIQITPILEAPPNYARAFYGTSASKVTFDLLPVGGGGTPSPTPTPTPTPSATASPTPSPSPTPTGVGGTYPTNPNDSLFADQWGMTKINAPQAWQEDESTGFGIKVAVLDTGLDLGHPDFACPGKVEVIANSDYIGDGNGPQDGHGHGSHVAGIVGACTDNNKGVVGVAPDATIMPVQVLDAAGEGQITETLPGAIRSATDAGAHVINMSLGTLEVNTPIDVLLGEVFPEVEEAINYAIGRGVVVVAAAGNSSFPMCSYPAIVEDIVCVGSTDRNDLNSYFGNFPVNDDNEDGLGAGLVAPGGQGTFCEEGIVSTYLRSKASVCYTAGYDSLDGTSMASPHVAGAAALVYDRLGAVRTAGNGRAVVEALISTTDDLYAPGYDPLSGYGRLNALAAVQSITVEPTDSDGDGILDGSDNCPAAANPGQEDADGDGLGDACDTGDPDADADGVADADDNCPDDANPGQEDADSDGIGDACESTGPGGIIFEGEGRIAGSNPASLGPTGGITQAEYLHWCDGLAPFSQGADGFVFFLDEPISGEATATLVGSESLIGAHDLDMYFYSTDCDLLGAENTAEVDETATVPVGTSVIIANAWIGLDTLATLTVEGGGSGGDTDGDGDGVLDGDDNCPEVANEGQQDSDDDGLGDACDGDRDGDGVANDTDNCPDIANPGQEDADGDGTGDACEGNSDPGCTRKPDHVYFLGIAYDPEQRTDFVEDIDNFEYFLDTLRDTYCIPAAQATILAMEKDGDGNKFTDPASGKTYDEGTEANLKAELSRIGAEASKHQDSQFFFFLSSHGNAQTGAIASCSPTRLTSSFSALKAGGGEDGYLDDCELGDELNEGFSPQTRMYIAVDCSFCGGFSDSLTAASGTIPDGSVVESSGIPAPNRIVTTGCAITTECFGSPAGGGSVMYRHMRKVLEGDFACDGWTVPGFPDFQGIDLPVNGEPFNAPDGRCTTSELFFASVWSAYNSDNLEDNAIGIQQQFRIKYGLSSLEEDLLLVSYNTLDTAVAFTDTSATSGQWSDDVTLEARLIDENDNVVPNEVVTFALEGEGEDASEEWTATTDADGLASITEKLTLDPGAYDLTTSYDGRPGSYRWSADTQGFLVTREDSATSLVAEGYGANRLLTATLSELDTPDSPLADATVEFTADDVSIGTAQTDESGVATLTPPSPHRKGARDFTASFAGSELFEGSLSAASTDVGLTTLELTPESATSGQYTDQAFLEARLLDEAGDPVMGADVVLELSGPGGTKSVMVATNESGLASESLTLDQPPGEYSLAARYAGLPREFAASESQTTFDLQREDSTMGLVANGYGAGRLLTAGLTDIDTPESGIANVTVEFRAGGNVIGTAQTDSAGVAQLAPPAPYRTGGRTFTASFAGNDLFIGSADQATTAEVATSLAFTQSSAKSVQFTDQLRIEVRLLDGLGEPVSGAQIDYELTGPAGSRAITDVTNASGVASKLVSINEIPGNYSLSARYAGELSVYSSSANSLQVKINRENSATALTVTGNGSNRVLRATVKDADAPGAPIVGRYVHFFAGNDWIGSTTTNASGVATLSSLPSRYRGGRHTYGAIFTGDDYFIGSVGTRSS